MNGPTTQHRRWMLVLGLVRAAASSALMVALYYVLPFERRSDSALALELALGVALFAGVVAWQVRAIIRANNPGIRATQALAPATPLFLLLFASTYFIMALDNPATFSEPLSRSDALYFTITIFSTVGFGDITAQAETGRLVVTVQMLLDLIVLGLGIKVILGAVQRGRAN